MKNFFSHKSFFFAFTFTFSFLAVQAQTQYYWNPAGSSTSAKDKNNWRVGTCAAATKAFPSTGGVANFSNCATTNCTIDTTFSVSNIAVTSGYSGTITQSGSNVVTCHKGSFKGGTFTGSSAAITCDSSLTIDGTAFTSTSGTLTTAEFTYKSGSFTHNSGSVVFKKGSTSITTLSSTANSVNVTFYNAEFSSSNANTVFNVKNINMIITNTMTMSGSNDLFLNSNTSSKIEVQGDLTITNGSTTGGGTCLLNFDGTGTQNLTGTTGGSGTGKLCNMKVNKSSGTLNYSNNITLGGSCQFEYTAGTINPGTSMFNCYYNNILKKTSSSEWDFNNLNMMGTGGRDSMIGTITVLGNFSTSHTGDCIITRDTIDIKGNVDWQNTGTTNFGNVTFKLSGGASQTFSAAVEPQLKNLIINKSANAITLQHALSITNNLNLVSKNLITDTTNILTLKSGATVSSVSSSSFVSGPIKKIGNSTFTFPVGKGSVYKPIAITAPSSSTDAFTAQYFNSQQSHGTNKDSITYLSSCEYWNVKRSSGSSNIKITLYWDNSTCAIYTLQTLKIGRWDGSKWNNTGMCTTTGNTASGSIQTNNNLSAFGDFMIAKRSPAVFAHAGNDISICSGVSHAVGASPSATSGLTPYTYAWSPSTALSSSSVANPTSTATSTTHYILTVTDLDHTVAVDTIIVTVHPNPIADAGDDTTVCKDFEFHIGGSPTASSGTSPYNYLWKNTSGDTLFQVANPFVEADTSFISFLTVTDSFGCKGRDTIEVSIPTPIEINFNFDTTLYLNQSVQLNPIVTGGVGSLNYSWSPSWWLNDSTIVNPVCVPRSSIRYTLVVGDSLNCIREAFTRIRFSPIDLQALNQYAIFSPDSIFVGDSSIAIGGVGSTQVDTSYLHIPFGFLETDSFVLASLTDQLSEIMDGIDGLAADTIDGDLSGDTLYSGTYRIVGSAQLNGTLTLAGNDSSYIILDIDSDWNVSDFSKIVHSGIVDDKVFFSVNGKIVMGDSLELNCFFLSEKSISIGSFVGSAVFLVKESTTISSSAFKLECTNDDPDCWTQLDFLTIQIELPDKLPRTRKGLVWNSEHTLVFDDEFATDLNILSWTIDEWWDERTNYQWFEYGGWGDVERNTFYDPELTGDFSGITTFKTLNGDLILRATNLQTEVFQLYPATDPDTGEDYNYKYSAGSIESNARFYHGYFEIKAKMPYGQGMWPSFWMIDGTCPGGEWWVPDHDDKREIDFFDASLPKTVFPVVEFYDHCQDGWLEYFACPKDQEGNSVNLSDNWHIYAADWDNDIITYYVDGVPMLSYTSESTMPNIMGVRDQAMRLELGTGVTSKNAPNFASNATTGTAPNYDNNERDFQIAYIKIWQKKNHVSDCYFVNDFNGERIDPIFCLSNTFHVATTYIQDATYSWTLPANWTATDFLLYQTASSEKLITPSSTAAGSYTIHLKITLPQIGNQKAGIVDEQDINVWIGEPDAPTFDYAPTPFYLYANNHWTIFPVDNADSYEWDFTLGNGDPSDGLILSPSGTYCGIETLEPGSYKIKARAHNVCGYSEWSQLTLYVNDEPCSGNGCKVLDSTSLNSLIQIYPSPSDGHLSIKNNSNEKVFITLKMINGIAVTNFYLQPDESTKINNLPQGLLLAESWIESNHTLLLRQLIPIVNP